MSAEKNKALLQQYIQEVWHRGNTDALESFLAPHYTRHRSPNQPALNRAEQKQLLLGFRAAFPDVWITVEDVIAESDRVAFRSIMAGTHRGNFLGLTPTGQRVRFELLDIMRIEKGQIVEQWGGPNVYDLLMQLGVTIT